MKYFSPTTSGWSTKVNFVDENNVFVGYDFSNECCESFGWYVSDTLEHAKEGVAEFDDTFDTDIINAKIESFRFDKQFFEEENEDKDYDVNSTVIFRLFNESKELFLVLYNSHNGYYSHGFEFIDDQTVIREGSL